MSSSAKQNLQKLKGAYHWWKKPNYYAPVVSPLQRGPDFSFLNGIRPAITSRWELERRQKHVLLGRKIVQYLAELREAEELFKHDKLKKNLNQERIDQNIPKAKGLEEIF